MSDLETIVARLAAIEHKLDILIAALAEEAQEDEPEVDLDTGRVFAHRDTTKGLG